MDGSSSLTYSPPAWFWTLITCLETTTFKIWPYLARHCVRLLFVTYSICHCLHDCLESHTSIPPGFHKHFLFSLLFLAILQLPSQLLLKQRLRPSDHSGFSLQACKNTRDPPGGGGFKISQHISFPTCSGFSDKKWTWLAPYFSDVVVGIKKKEWILFLFKWFIWQNLVVVSMRGREKLRMTQVSGLGNWVDTGWPSFILTVAMTSY